MLLSDNTKKVVDLIHQFDNLSNIDKDSADRAGVGGSATFNNIMNMLPGNSML